MSEVQAKKRPKLHELIAVKASLRTQAAKTTTDLANTFEKKQHHFTARTKTFTANGESVEPKVEENLELQTTVPRELSWVGDYIAKAIDANHFVNVGNRQASADIVTDSGTVILSDIPVTTLLELEGKMVELRSFAEKIPTLDPAKGFKPAPERGMGVFVAREVEKIRSQKQNRIMVLAPATDKHPAQTQLVAEDMPTGIIREQEWSAMLTISQKAIILDRIEELTRAIKKARSRGNEQEVSTGNKIGKVLLTTIFDGIWAG